MQYRIFPPLARLVPAILAATLMLQPPAGQAGPFAPAVMVNGSAVTGFEIDQRLRFMQLLNAPNATRDEVVEELISDRLKMAAAHQLGITVSDESLTSGLAEFAGRANMVTDEFTAALAASGVEPETYRDFVRVGLAWRELIRRRVLPGTDLTEAEVDRALTRILDTPQVTDVLISELVMAAPEGGEEQVLDRAAQLSTTITTEGGFASAARQHSAAPTADAGGRLPWMRVADLPQGLGPILTALKPGEVTQPLQIPGAVVLFYLRDTRGVLRPGAKNEEVDYLTVTVASPGEGAAILANATSCDTFHAAAGNAAPAVQRQTLPTNALPAGIGVRLASLDDQEGTIVDLGGAAQVIMLCSRQRSLIAAQSASPADGAPDTLEAGTAPSAGDLPPRDVVRDNLFNQKVNEAADAYLAELRANAIIHRP